jgi:VWFA-related protein
MLYRRFPARAGARPLYFKKIIFTALCLLVSLGAMAVGGLAQSLERDFDTPEKVLVTIKNRNGRVTVAAFAEQQKRVSLKAESPGAPVAESDLSTQVKGDLVEIDVRGRRDLDRIDLMVRVPERARVRVESEAGAVDVVGNFEEAEVETNTGTIHADVPLEALRFNFLWQASRPRFLSDVELPKVKEKAGGWFAISGKLGDKKAKKEELVKLNFTTQRGVVLLNIDPATVPSDLRERPLTEAAKAIVRSGNTEMVDSIRNVSPRFFGDYAKTLPPPKDEPALASRRAAPVFARQVAPQLMRLNASVTDRQGRAISGLKANDFTVIENGEERRVMEVAPATEPFNLVLLLDVSGSVEDHINFIRKAARDFLRTASPQDSISIISFRDDIQVISDFTTDRQLLSRRLEEIDAGGATALYDALAYALVEQLRKVRGERTAIVVLSDGDDNRSFVPFPSVLEATIESGALIYPLYVPSGLIPEASVPASQTTIDPLRARYLTITTRAEEEGRQLAQVSGGVYFPVTRLEDLQKAYDDIVAQLRMAYTITYASNNTDTRERRVRVRANRDGASVRLSPAVGLTMP